MFGLQIPLAKTLPCASSDFDSVNTILSNSIYKADRSVWTPRTDDKGNIFYLQLDTNTQLNKPRHYHSCTTQRCHGNSFSSNNGFATDDTGYGTDTEYYLHGETSTATAKLNKVNQSKHCSEHCAHFDVSTDLVQGKCEKCNTTSAGYNHVLDFNNMENLCAVTLKIDTATKNGLSSTDRSKKIGHVGRALCKNLLGIVPGHFRTKDYPEKSSKSGQRLCVRSLVKDSPAARNPDIRIGDCLRLVNGREVTWDNIDDVFLQLTKFKQVKLVLQGVARQTLVPVLVRDNLKLSTDEEQAQTLIEQRCFPEMNTTEYRKNFIVTYLNLEALYSEQSPADKDVVYQFPPGEHTLSEIRGCFITLYQVLGSISESQIKRSSFIHEGEIIHVGYHKEENGLLLFMYPASKVHSAGLPTIVSDVVRVLRVQYGSVRESFSDKKNTKELNMFFSLFHKNKGVPQSNVPNCVSVNSLCCFGRVQYLPLCNSVQDAIDKVINKWEAADFAEMSDSFYGCRRTYTILGSCLFHKTWMLCNHLPKDDVHDLYLYLKYHSLLGLCERESVKQLVVWREVHPTRQWYDLGEEQMFGYTEPVSARWFWLIVGYKHTLLCSLLEAGGCTSMKKKVQIPDTFYIDQAKATLMQIVALDLPSHCDTSYGNPLHSLVSPVEKKSGVHISPIRRSVEKLSAIIKDDGIVSPPRMRQVSQNLIRKDSFNSEESAGSSSSGGSSKKTSRTRLFPAEAVYATEMNHGEFLPNQHIKLTVGSENCLFHFIHVDKMEGIYIVPVYETNGLQKEVIHNFHLGCTHIKHMFDRYRYRKKNASGYDNDVENLKMPSNPDTSFYNIREEGILFNVDNLEDDSMSTAYWTVGRQRSKQELYVCFRDSTPQCMVELAFRMGFGLKP